MREDLVALLIDKGKLDKAVVEECLKAEVESGQSLDRVLLTRGAMPEEKLLLLFGQHLGVDFLPDLSNATVLPEFIQRIPVQFAL